ncbi:MAG TPA: YncE family protein [Bacteroidia bacterium]|jgi:YVTN family beta-propeller protein|nr:YncE family protein [Bacteroidia bacterium]
MKKIFFVSAAILFCSALNAQTKTEHVIANKIPVEGDGGWDYLTADELSDRLYVSHGTMVQVIDTKTNKVIGTIPDTKGVHGITLAHDLNKGFISNGRDTSVTIFDIKTLKTIGKVKVTGVNPDAILYDKFSHKVFVYNGRSKNATVIDAKTDKVVETIALEGKPEFSATDEKGKIYVNIEDKNMITVINATTLKVEQNWPIAPGEEPTGLALDNKTHRLFTVCGNKLMVVIDATNGKVIANLPIGDGCDGVAFEPTTNRAYSSNGEGTVTVVQEENETTFKVIETIQTQKGARTICINPKTHHVYLSAGEYEEMPPAADGQRQRPKVKAGSFVILDIELKK